jgi:hypothetical protein
MAVVLFFRFYSRPNKPVAGMYFSYSLSHLLCVMSFVMYVPEEQLPKNYSHQKNQVF